MEYWSSLYICDCWSRDLLQSGASRVTRDPWKVYLTFMKQLYVWAQMVPCWPRVMAIIVMWYITLEGIINLQVIWFCDYAVRCLLSVWFDNCLELLCFYSERVFMELDHEINNSVFNTKTSIKVRIWGILWDKLSRVF